MSGLPCGPNHAALRAFPAFAAGETTPPVAPSDPPPKAPPETRGRRFRATSSNNSASSATASRSRSALNGTNLGRRSLNSVVLLNPPDGPHDEPTSERLRELRRSDLPIRPMHFSPRFSHSRSAGFTEPKHSPGGDTATHRAFARLVSRIGVLSKTPPLQEQDFVLPSIERSFSPRIRHSRHHDLSPMARNSSPCRKAVFAAERGQPSGVRRASRAAERVGQP